MMMGHKEYNDTITLQSRGIFEVEGNDHASLKRKRTVGDDNVEFECDRGQTQGTKNAFFQDVVEQYKKRMFRRKRASFVETSTVQNRSQLSSSWAFNANPTKNSLYLDDNAMQWIAGQSYQRVPQQAIPVSDTDKSAALSFSFPARLEDGLGPNSDKGSSGSSVFEGGKGCCCESSATNCDVRMSSLASILENFVASTANDTVSRISYEHSLEASLEPRMIVDSSYPFRIVHANGALYTYLKHENILQELGGCAASKSTIIGCPVTDVIGVDTTRSSGIWPDQVSKCYKQTRIFVKQKYHAEKESNEGVMSSRRTVNRFEVAERKESGGKDKLRNESLQMVLVPVVSGASPVLPMRDSIGGTVELNDELQEIKHLLLHLGSSVLSRETQSSNNDSVTRKIDLTCFQTLG